jgi:hypothetical protein
MIAARKIGINMDFAKYNVAMRLIMNKPQIGILRLL